MRAITNEKRRTGGGRLSECPSGSSGLSEPAVRTEARFIITEMAACLVAICLILGGIQRAEASFIEVPLESVAQLTVDENNEPLDYPTSVFYDPHEDEIYLINGGTGRVVVYNQDFFPYISIGQGRGVAAPRDGVVMENGEVYLCQVQNFKNPERRITVLNPAFFVDREIFLNQIPEAEDFNARNVAVSADGTIYLAGNDNRGVLVIDRDGRFLRRLEPMGQVSARVLSMEEENRAKMKGSEEEQETEETDSEERAADTGEEDAEDPYAHIPEEFRPQTERQKKSAKSGDILAAVKINHVTIDRSGRIYLISPEVGKIFVYGPDESFLFSFGMKGGSPGQMSNPRSLAIDEKRRLIYVVDYMRHTILAFNMEGKHLFEVGGRGVQPLWFNYPSGVAVNSRGHLIVADLFNKRVQVIELAYEDVVPLLEAKPSEASASSDDAEPSAETAEIDEPSPEKAAPAEIVEDPVIREEIIEDAEISGHPQESSDEEPADQTGPGTWE